MELFAVTYFEVNGYITCIDDKDNIYTVFMLGTKNVDVAIPREKISFEVKEGKPIRISHKRYTDGTKIVVIQEGHCV